MTPSVLRELCGFMAKLCECCVKGEACSAAGPSAAWSAEVPPALRAFSNGAGVLRAESVIDFMEAALTCCLHKRELCRLDGSGSGSELDRVISSHRDYRARIAAAHLRGEGGGGLRRWLNQHHPARLICLVTHSCQLSCSYCRVGKYPAEMSREVLERSIDLLFTSSSSEVQLQFFGGEPLLRFELVRLGAERALAAARKSGKRLRLILTTNGLLLDEEKAALLKRWGFTVEISCDGTSASQLATRGAAGAPASKAPLRVMAGLAAARKLKLDYYVIMVVTPGRVGKLLKDFSYIAAAGHERIQINYALGTEWSGIQMLSFLRQLEKIRTLSPGGADCVNLLRNRTEPVVLNAERTVDCDGFVLRETGVCLEKDFRRMRERFAVGDVRSLPDIDSSFTTQFQNFELLADAYAADKPEFRRIILNNVKFGRLMERWSLKHSAGSLGL